MAYPYGEHDRGQQADEASKTQTLGPRNTVKDGDTHVIPY